MPTEKLIFRHILKGTDSFLTVSRWGFFFLSVGQITHSAYSRIAHFVFNSHLNILT